MEAAKGVKHNVECEKSQFLKELKKLKQRACQLRCQIGELVLVSERLEEGERRCEQLQRRLECYDGRVSELEAKLWKKTQEVELAHDTYRMLRRDLEDFNKNLTSDESCSASPRDKKSLMRSGGKRKRRRKEEDAEEEEKEENGIVSSFQRSSDCSPPPHPLLSSPSAATRSAGPRTATERTDPKAKHRSDGRTVLSIKYNESTFPHNRQVNEGVDCDGGRRRKTEDALLQQQLINYEDDNVVAKRRKTTDKKQEEESEKKEEEEEAAGKADRNLDGPTESATEGQRGKEEGERGRRTGGGGGGGGRDCDEEDQKEEEEEEQKDGMRPLQNCSSYVVEADQGSKFQSSVQAIQPTSAVASPNKKTSCLPSIRICEVHPRGKYIRIINASHTKAEDLGNHFLLQRYQDTPFTVFRFPSAVCLRPLGVATVWSACGAAEESDAGRQLLPTDFIFSSQPIWASGPDCITILCKPNEQALNWLSSSPCLSKRPDPSCTGALSLKKSQVFQQGCSTSSKGSCLVCPEHENDHPPPDCKDDPAKEWPTKASRSCREERCRSEDQTGAAEKGELDCNQSPNSSPQRRRTGQRRKGASAEEDSERRRKTGDQSEAKKRKKKEVKDEQRSKWEEEECCGCEEEIRLNSSRRRRRQEKCEEEDEQRSRRRSTGRGSPGRDDCWKGVAVVMDKRIPCTCVHIEDPTTSSAKANGCKATEGRGRGGGGGRGGGCVEEQSECGARDCFETDRSKSKNLNGAMNDGCYDDNDCSACGSSESSKQKRSGHASLGRCVDSSEAASKGSSRSSECKERKEKRNASRGAQRRDCEDAEDLVQRKAGGGRSTKRGGGGCGSEEEEDEDDCSKQRKGKRSPCKRRNCDDFVEGKKKKDNVVVKDKSQKRGCGGGGVPGCGGCGGGGGGRCAGGCGGGGGGCGKGGCGGAGKRKAEECAKDDCCGRGKEVDGSWMRWKKWLTEIVSSPRKGPICRDQPCFSSSTLDCTDRASVADTEVTCYDEVQVREVCRPCRPRLSQGCACPDGCPTCPPKRPDCSEEVGIAERSRQRPMKKKTAESKCPCAQDKREAAKRDARCAGSRSEGCLTTTGVCNCWCHLDSVAVTAASVMAAGLTVAAIYCN